MKEKYVLLLTGTIVPFHESRNGRFDPDQREQDYFQALSFYLAKGFRVVFCENSNTNSAKILALKSKFNDFEYLTFQTQRSHLGKSQGEVEIINYAIAHSEILRSVDYLVKITGRYIIKNISLILEGTQGFQSPIYINPTRNLRWADSRLMMMKKSYYTTYFLRAVELYLDESKQIFMENAFMKSLFLYLLDGGELNLWPAYPSYEGMDGTHNEPVTFNFFKELKYNFYYKLKKFTFKHRA